MKLTKNQLKRIIKEEKSKILQEKRLLREFSHSDEQAHSIVGMIVDKACIEGLIAEEDAWRLQEIVEYALLGGESGDAFRFAAEEH